MIPPPASKAIGRNKAFALLGTIPFNPRNAWCAIAPDESLAVFTLWDNEITRKGNLIFVPDDVHRSGGKNQKEVLEKVLAGNIPAYGIVCMARDIHAKKYEIKKARTDFLIELKIVRERDGGMRASHVGKVPFWETVAKRPRKESSTSSAIDDLEAPAGNPFPDRAWALRGTFVRDAAVRRAVIKRSGGMCEHCGNPGFLTLDGRRYVETHHIIALARQGRDTLENVIALCPDHHRQAHFGADAEEFEKQLIRQLKKIRAGKKPRQSKSSRETP